MEKTSRTQKKREASSLQKIGEKLVQLTDAQIEEIVLPEEVVSAVSLAKSIKKHGPRKRQMQYLGVLMRRIDTTPIQEALLKLEEGDRRQVEQQKQAERRRNELIGGNDALLDELLGKLPVEEREMLRDHVKKAREEILKTNASPTPSRVLFRFLLKSPYLISM